MEKLKIKFSKIKDSSKFYFSQIERFNIGQNEIAIYGVSHEENEIWWFEGFEIKCINKTKYENGKFVKLDELRELYPYDEDFGKTAFSHPNLEELKKILINRFS